MFATCLASFRHPVRLLSDSNARTAPHEPCLRFAHNYANLRSMNLARLKARVKVPPMLNAAARGPSRSSRIYQQQEG